jgi:hypothetical protein
MNINLQKINNFSELKEKTLVALTNTDNAEYTMVSGAMVSLLTYEVASIKDGQAFLKALNKNQLSSNMDMIVVSESTFKSLNIHKVDFTKEVKEAQDTNEEVVALKRKLRKADKKNRAFKAILKKHDIATNQESQELREFAKKIQRLRQRAFAVSMVDQFTENIVGFNADIIVGTNYVNEVEVIISVDRESNPFEKLPRDISVVGTSKVHPEDKFNYNTGVHLALMRAKLKLMEQILK